LNGFIIAFGEALSENTKLEGLSLKGNKINYANYCNFWVLLLKNKTLRKMNLSSTDLNDKSC
jgi:hypothetical protein